MADCPNCGKDVPEGERMCPACGFDTGEAQADNVRALREAGQIHPGRLGASDENDFAGGEVPRRVSGLPSEDREDAGPEELDAGF
jgi:hypothetical protein